MHWPRRAMFQPGIVGGVSQSRTMKRVMADKARRLARWIKASTGSLNNGLYALAGSMVLAAVVPVAGVRAPRRRPAPIRTQATAPE